MQEGQSASVEIRVLCILANWYDCQHRGEAPHDVDGRDYRL